MKKILFLLSVILFSNLSYSQFVTISTNLQGSNLGRVSTDKYFSTQGIYTNAEIGDANFTTQELAINKVSIRVKEAFSATINDSFKIWMRDLGSDTTKFTRAGGVQYKYSTAGFTLVYKGSISLTDTGWKEILLQTTFKRTAGKNLLVIVERLDNQLLSQGQLWASTGTGTSGADSSCRRYQGTTPPVVNTTNLSPTVYRLAMQFIHQLPTDAGIIGITNPVVSCYGSNQSVKVKVKNFGLNTIASGAASVTLRVRGANIYSGTLTNNAAIASGDTAILNFNNLNINNEGVSYDTAIVTLFDDGSADNDKSTSTISTASTIYNLPAIEDFDVTTPLFSFRAIDKGTNQLWNSQVGTYTNAGPQSISPRDTGVSYYLMEGYNQPNGSSGWVSRLYSNCIVLPGTSLSVPTRTAKVSFWMSHDNFTSAGADSMYVTVSTDKGTTWTRLQGFARYSATAGAIASWKKDSVDISQFVGQTVQVGFDAVRQFGSFGLDDITVTTDPVPPPICVNPPTANAGTNTTICSISNYNLNNANPTYGGSATSASWFSSGSGTFTGGTDYDFATGYVPSAADVQAGSVEISLITNNPVGGVCVSDTSTFTLSIDKGSFNATTLTNCESYTWNNNTYTESGDYTFEYNNSNGCPSTDTLHLTITNGDFTSTTQSACGSYIWSSNSQTYTASGNYTNSYTNTAGCVSTDTLHLTITTPSFTSTTEVECDSFVWALNGQTYTNSGTYIYSSGVECLSADTLHLTINNSTHNVSTITNCESYTWSANDQTYTASGTYVYTYTNGSDCPSADTLHLTITNGTHNATTISSCNSYTWSANDQTYTESGDYVYTYTNGSNCASADTLHLTITTGTFNASTITNCDSYTWSANGQTYTESGDYIYTYNNGSNCASADTLHLTITSSTSSDTTAFACGSFVWYGTTYNASGNPTRILTNANNCDSVITLHLTIGNANTGDTTALACESFDWYGITYTTSGTATHIFTNASGCDSLVTLHLTIGTPSSNDTSVVACGSYTWNGYTFNSSTDTTITYTTATGCDSSLTLRLTINAIPSVSSISGPDTVDVLSTITLTNSTSDGVWSSADDNLATVDQQGLVLGLSVGDVLISYTVSDAITGCSNSASYAVNVHSITLPVSLINFSARLIDKNHAIVSWNVNNEIKLNHYEVERSLDGVSFMNRNNKSVSGSTSYTYLDELNTTASTVYYRIKMVNDDGTFKYSNIIMVRITEMNTAAVVYPNPFTNSITIEYNSLVEEKVIVNLMSMEGKKLQQKVVSVHAGSNKINLDRLNILPNGTYMLEIVNSANKAIKQIMKR